MPLTDTAKELFQQQLGVENVIQTNDPGAVDFLTEQRGELPSQPALIVTPESTDAVAMAVKTANRFGLSIVPQSGNTGLCGGATATPDELLLSLKRLNRIRASDPLNHTLTVEAGCLLSDVQQAALAVDRFFPLSLGSEGSCMLGGNLATNAGGINVLRYGNARQMVLGLEVVLSDGRIWNGLGSLLKNNTGYDLKHVFLGSEGTLGIITAAVLRIFPRPVRTSTLWLGIQDLEQAIHLFSLAKAHSSDQVSSFELIPERSVQTAMRHTAGLTYPLQSPCPWHLLIQLSASSPLIPVDDIGHDLVERGMADNLISDGVIAQSLGQEQTLWRIREALVPAQKREGLCIKHDISVPVSRIPELVSRGCAAAASIMPGIRPYPFGHLGDGNLHFNMLQPKAMDPETFYSLRPRVHEAIYDIVMELGGSFSAEHGIGLIKTVHMDKYKSAVEMDLMRQVKSALDPGNHLNPGKVLPEQ